MKRIQLELIAKEMSTCTSEDDAMFPNCTDSDIFIQGFTSGIEYSQRWIPIAAGNPEIGKTIILKGKVRVYGNNETKYVEKILGITKLQENGEYDRRLLPFYSALTDKITAYRYLDLMED